MDTDMKKALAAVLYTSTIAFGLSAYAADDAGTGVVEKGIKDLKVSVHEHKTEHAADRTLAKKVRIAMTHEKTIDMTRINVLARSGAVTLIGSVPDESQIALAEKSAVAVAGVKSVKNNLLVEEGGN
jgi:hyperosmotically inducible periplasmic protein